MILILIIYLAGLLTTSSFLANLIPLIPSIHHILKREPASLHIVRRPSTFKHIFIRSEPSPIIRQFIIQIGLIFLADFLKPILRVNLAFFILL